MEDGLGPAKSAVFQIGGGIIFALQYHELGSRTDLMTVYVPPGDLGQHVDAVLTALDLTSKDLGWLADGVILRPVRLTRQDDNGVQFHVGDFPCRADAESIIARLAAGAHKQGYFIEAIDGKGPRLEFPEDFRGPPVVVTDEKDEVLPTAAEIALPCLDGQYAIEHFHGKTLAEAEELFASGCPLWYTEDLLWMEPVGFRFYIQAAIRYCLSERAVGDSDIVSGLEGTLALWHEQHPGELVSCAGALEDFCNAVVRQFDRYDADPKIYGPLRERYQRMADTFGELKRRPTVEPGAKGVGEGGGGL